MRDGDALQLSPAQSCLLALAYGSGAKGVTRQEAAWLLWEEDDSPAARHRLSQLLYGMRKRVGVECVDEAASGCIRGVLVSDFGDLDRVLQARDFTALRGMLERGLLSELPAPTASFAHWLDGKRASVRRSCRDVAAAELASAEAAGDWRKVAGAAEVLLDLDPLDEAMLRRLLHARALSGSRVELDAALRSYGERFQVISGERWTPERATIHLVERIERTERATERDDTPQPALIGRAEPLRRLYRALSARSQTVHFTVVAGEAGIGKTRLIREALARLRLEGFTVLESGSSQLQRDLPLNALLGALTDKRVVDSVARLEEPWRSSLTMLLPHLAGEAAVAPPALDPQATSRRLMEAMYQLMGRVAVGGPTVLFLDDLQWIDKTTLCTIEFLGERRPPLSLSVVFGLRDDAESDQSLRSFLDGVRARGTWIELEELDQASADELLAAASPRRLTQTELTSLGRVAGRSPFFLIELVNDYCAQPHGPHPYDPQQHIPSSIRQLVSNRLDALSRDARTLLQLLSVAGRMNVDAPIPLKDLPASRVPDIADDLLRARLIHHEAGVVDIRHDLIRQTTYDLMGPIKKAALHRRAAQAILDRAGDSAHGEAALHFDRAGDKGKAYKYAVSAAGAAQSSGAVHEAIRFWETARRNAGGDEELRVVLGNLAELLYDARRLEDVVQVISAALTHCPEDARRYALMRLDAMSELPGAAQEVCLGEAERIVAQALDARDWTQYVEAVEVRLRILYRLHRENDMRAQLHEVRKIRDQDVVRSPYALCLLHSILSLLLGYDDDDEGMSSAHKAVEIARQHGIDRLHLRALHRALLCHLLRGDLSSPEATRLTEEALQQAAHSGDQKYKAGIYNALGCHYLDTADYRRAEQYLSESEACAAGPSERALIYLNLGELSYCKREYERAETFYRLALDASERQPVHGFLRVAVDTGIGLCALAKGQLSVAQSYEAAVRNALQTWVHDPHMLVRFLAELERRRGRPEEAVRIIRERAVKDERRPTYWIRSKILEAQYLRLVDPKAADALWQHMRDETQKRGLARMLTA
jgi:DNA-binding SARP family transcriptional activator/tetratricopeptide (TPR) repeat protein